MCATYARANIILSSPKLCLKFRHNGARALADEYGIHVIAPRRCFMIVSEGIQSERRLYKASYFGVSLTLQLVNSQWQLSYLQFLRYRSPKRMKLKCSTRAWFNWARVLARRRSQLHMVQDFAIRRKSYCSRAAEKSLLLTISVCSAWVLLLRISEDTKELQIARLRTWFKLSHML
jgi:hypothetical protein